MGCDIHTHTERRDGNTWVSVPLSPPVWDWRSYGLFGFIAGVRNCWAVKPIAQPRGFPEDASDEATSGFDDWDGHTPSYLTLQEMLALDYDAPIIDEEGERTTLRVFLGEPYFNDLARMQKAGVERVVFWFDN